MPDKKTHDLTAGTIGAAGGMTRRAVLKGLGYGAAAAALAPKLFVRNAFGAKLQDAQNAVWTMTSGDTLGGPAIFSRGSVLLNGTNTSHGDAGGPTFADVTSIDAQTGVQQWQWSVPAMNTTVQAIIPVDPSLLVITSDGNMYSLNPDSGAATRAATLPTRNGITRGGDRLYFAATNGDLACANLQGSIVWRTAVAGLMAPPTVASGVALVVANSVLSAWDAGSGDRLWLNNDSTFAFSPAVGAGYVYAVAQTATASKIVQIDLHTGMIGWESQSLSRNLSIPSYYCGIVYVADDHGLMYAIDANTGTTVWHARVADSAENARFFFEDGVAYFGAITAGKLHATAVDLTQRGQDVISWIDPAGIGTDVIGAQSGVCYVMSSSGIGMTVRAVPLASVIHAFLAESELMADGYAASGSKVVGQSPVFRSTVRLVDAQKNPRANKSVKIWASAPAAVTVSGQTYQLDLDKSAWVDTDTLGELSLVSPADTIDTPALYLWSVFMAQSEAIVIYPDHDTVARLSTLQGSDLQKAASFDGTPIVPSSFTGYDALASMMRGLVGNPGSSLSATQQHHVVMGKTSPQPTREGEPLPNDTASAAGPRRRFGASGPRYLAYPASNRNLLYQPVATSTERHYVPGNGPQAWTLDFVGTGVTFSPTAVPPVEQTGLVGWNPWKALKDFGDDVVHGAKKVAHAVWNEGEMWVTDEAKQIYHFFVKTIEDAYTVAKGVFKTICQDIEKVVEWLSYLFEWKDILDVKEQMKAKVKGAFADLATWLQGQQDGNFAGVNSLFQKVESGLQTVFTGFQSGFGLTTIATTKGVGTDPQSFFGAYGAKSFAKTQWLLDKVRDNLPHGRISARGAVALALTDDPFLDAFETLAKSIANTIATSATAIPNEVLTICNRFANLAADPSRFVTLAFNDILQTMSDVLVDLLKFTNAIVDDILSALVSFVKAVLAKLEASIDIPVVSDLYRAISGSSLSVIDLACLMAAVPTTIIQKAKAGVAGTARVQAIALNDTIAFLAASIFYVPFDTIMDADDTPPTILKLMYVGLCAVMQGLNFPTDLASNRAGDYVFYAALAIPLVLSTIDFTYSAAADLNPSDDAVEKKEAFGKALPEILGFYGSVMFGVSLFLGMTDPVYRGSDGLLMVQNLVGSLPFVAKPLVNIDEKLRAVVVTIDATCDTATFGIGFGEHFA